MASFHENKKKQRGMHNNRNTVTSHTSIAFLALQHTKNGGDVARGGQTESGRASKALTVHACNVGKGDGSDKHACNAGKGDGSDNICM